MAWENTNEAAWLKGEEAERGCGGGIQRVAITYKDEREKGWCDWIEVWAACSSARTRSNLFIVLCIGN